MSNIKIVTDAIHAMLFVLSALPMFMGLSACIQGAVGLYIARRTGDGPRYNKARIFLIGGVILLIGAAALRMPVTADWLGHIIVGV